MKKYLLFILLLISFQSNSQERQSIEQFHYLFQVDDKGFHGNGWDILKDNAELASVVFIGEDHGLAEIPKLTKHLSSHLIQNGFNTYLGEIGSLSAKALLSKMQEGKHREWLTINPISIPFVSWEEEMELLEYMNERNVDIYGIDQEFLFSPIILLTSLEKFSDDNQVIQKMINKETKAMGKFLSEGNYLDLFMVSSLEKDFDYLEKMFEQEEAKIIVNKLRSSFVIYRTMMNGKGKQSNELRAQMMRDNYDRIKLNNIESKLIVKLGAFHCFRENAPTGVEEIGEYVAKKDNSFHLLVLGNKGKFNNYTAQSGFNESQREASYDIKKRFPVDLSVFLDYIDENKWSYFDLKAMRNSDKQFVSEVEKLAKVYDALIIIPEVTASTKLE